MCCGCKHFSQSHRESGYKERRCGRSRGIGTFESSRPAPNRKVNKVVRKSKNPARLPTTTSLQSMQHSCNEGKSILIIRTMCEKESSSPRSEIFSKEKRILKQKRLNEWYVGEPSLSRLVEVDKMQVCSASHFCVPPVYNVCCSHIPVPSD